MKTIEANNNEEWLSARFGTIGGSDLAKFKTKSRTSEFTDVQFNFVAQEFFSPFEANAQRGHQLEIEALEELVKELPFGVVALENVLWKKGALHCSPDAISVYDRLELPETGIETKCLSAGKHLQAFLAETTEEFLGDYALQVANYFYCNEELQNVMLAYYCPEATEGVPKLIFRTFNRKQLSDLLDQLSEIDAKVQNARRDLYKKISEKGQK